MDCKTAIAIVGGWVGMCLGAGWLAGEVAHWLTM